MASFVMSVLRLEPPWYHKRQGDLRSAEGGIMLGKCKVALAMIGSFAFGAVAAQSLNAQVRPPAFVVAEINVKDREKFETQFLPPAIKAVEAAGGSYVIRGGRTVSLQGLPTAIKDRCDQVREHGQGASMVEFARSKGR
jgi:hypothetical protein